MSTQAVGDAPVAGPVVRDPRALAVAPQVLIGLLTVVQLAVGSAGGASGGLFPLYLWVSTVLMVASVVTFLRWFHRCRLNAEVFAPDGQRHSPGMAVGSWFIPFANFWIPFRITSDLWRSSGPARGIWLVNAWWAAWLGKSLVSYVLLKTHSRSNGYTFFEVAVGLVSGALAILLIRRLTDRQHATITTTAPTA